jgi:hypothetical protein
MPGVQEENKMSEGGDYEPGPWKGYDFADAKKAYNVHVDRSYDDAKVDQKTKKDFLEAVLKTDCESPLLICCDVTGSMGEWPATMFSKLPYLEHEVKEYLGKGTEISFGAVGDANSDTYPLQIRPFTKGKDLEKRMKELIVEKGGGGQLRETYEIAALYYARKVEMPNAIKPVLIMIGDEGFYDVIGKEHAKNIAGVNLQSPMMATDVFKELMNKYSVYLIRKPYNVSSSNTISADDQAIHKQWAKVLGEERIAPLGEPGRVVDVIFGILAKEAGRIDYFEQELIDRQGKDKDGTHKIDVVMKSLNTIHHAGNAKSVKKLIEGKSIMNRPKGSMKSVGLC